MVTELRFERTLQLFFGESQYQTAGAFGDSKFRRGRLRKVVKELMRAVDGLDTNDRHKRVLLADLEATMSDLDGILDPTWDLVLHLLSVVGHLLGYDYLVGSRCYTPCYFQDSKQHHFTKTMETRDPLHHRVEKTNAINIRQKLVDQLKEMGLTDFHVALVLNTSEYAVKKLKRGACSEKK